MIKLFLGEKIFMGVQASYCKHGTEERY